MPDANLQLMLHERQVAAKLDEAAAHGELAVVATREKATGDPVALVCWIKDEGREMLKCVPLARVLEPNHIDLYEDPTEGMG